MGSAEREAVSAAEKAERKQQLREKVSSSVLSGIPLPITNMNFLGYYRFMRIASWIIHSISTSESLRRRIVIVGGLFLDYHSR